jgi:hypothetical protein
MLHACGDVKFILNLDGTVTDYGLDDWDSVPGTAGVFLFALTFIPGLRADKQSKTIKLSHYRHAGAKGEGKYSF